MGQSDDGHGLSKETRDLERARQSLIEEMQAIIWYEERAEATDNESLRKILEHNRDEEKEHVAMLLEWIRRNDPVQDQVFVEHD
ncbi:MAG: ferritin [Chloroflexi bacterium]|nr:ferritin [Chloroflexota bacterium]